MKPQNQCNLFPAKKAKVSLLQFSFLSEFLGRQTTVNILLPYGCCTQNLQKTTKPYKTLLLLHGKSDDYRTWLRCSVIENLAREYEFAVVMPDAGNSFYADMAYGAHYYSYLVEELPTVLRELLPLSHQKGDNFIAGFSMGGYGALKIGLKNPQCFSAIGCFSSALNIAALSKKAFAEADTPFDDSFFRNCAAKGLNPEQVKYQKLADKRIFLDAFGENATHLENTDDDIYKLIRDRLADGTMPPIYQTCGTSDFLYEDNLAFRHFASSNNCNLFYEECEGGHTWEVWNKNITDYFKFLKTNSFI